MRVCINLRLVGQVVKVKQFNVIPQITPSIDTGKARFRWAQGTPERIGQSLVNDSFLPPSFNRSQSLELLAQDAISVANLQTSLKRVPFSGCLSRFHFCDGSFCLDLMHERRDEGEIDFGWRDAHAKPQQVVRLYPPEWSKSLPPQYTRPIVNARRVGYCALVERALRQLTGEQSARVCPRRTVSSRPVAR